MGGKLERIEIHALSSSDQGHAEERRGVDSLKEQFASFDAAKARCFLEEDRERLLAVIETGFGDFKDFNKRVRTAFAQRLRRRSCSGEAQRRRLSLRSAFQMAMTVESLAGHDAKASGAHQESV